MTPMTAKFVPEVFNDAFRANADAIELARQIWVQLKTLARSTAQVRHTLRAQGDFDNADALRDAIDKAGFYIEDKKLDGNPLPPVVYRK